METGVQHGNGNSNNATQLICESQAASLTVYLRVILVYLQERVLTQISHKGVVSLECLDRPNLAASVPKTLAD